MKNIRFQLSHKKSMIKVVKNLSVIHKNCLISKSYIWPHLEKKHWLEMARETNSSIHISYDVSVFVWTTGKEGEEEVDEKGKEEGDAVGIAWFRWRIFVVKSGLQSTRGSSYHPLFRCSCRNPDFWMNGCEIGRKDWFEIVFLINH